MSALVTLTTAVMTLTSVVVTRTTAALTLTSARKKHTSASKKQTVAPVGQTNAFVSATRRRVALTDHRFTLIRAVVRGARAPLKQTATRLPLTNAADKHASDVAITRHNVTKRPTTFEEYFSALGPFAGGQLPLTDLGLKHFLADAKKAADKA